MIFLKLECWNICCLFFKKIKQYHKRQNLGRALIVTKERLNPSVGTHSEHRDSGSGQMHTKSPMHVW